MKILITQRLCCQLKYHTPIRAHNGLAVFAISAKVFKVADFFPIAAISLSMISMKEIPVQLQLDCTYSIIFRFYVLLIHRSLFILVLQFVQGQEERTNSKHHKIKHSANN